MSKTLRMIAHELPKTMGELDYNLLYEDICQAVTEVNSLEIECDLLKKEVTRYKTALDRISAMCKVGCSACEAIYIESEFMLEEQKN